jgi:hypothetical protein
VLRLGDGAHLHLKTTQKKKELKLFLCLDLAMAPTWAQKKRGSSSFHFTKIWPWCPRSKKKNEKKGEQAPSFPNLGNGVLQATNQKKRKEKASSPFVES